MQIVFPNGHYILHGKPLPESAPARPFNRVAYAAAHVVADPLTNADPSGPPVRQAARALSGPAPPAGKGKRISKGG